MRTRKNGKLSAIQYCDECGVRIYPIFKADNDPEDWFWLECDNCGCLVCYGCSDMDGDERYCLTCLEDRMLRERRNRDV